MTALIAVAAWVVLSFPVTVLVGRWIAAADRPSISVSDLPRGADRARSTTTK